jgi:hypothetical protein
MKHTEAECREYLERNQVQDLLNEMTAAVCLNLPDDPVGFLIKYLESRQSGEVKCTALVYISFSCLCFTRFSHG